MSIDIVVKSRQEVTLAAFEKVEMGTTVQDFKKMFLEKCVYAKKKKLYPARLRFTVNEASGTPMTDPTKTLNHYIEAPSVTLYFKDLGP